MDNFQKSTKLVLIVSMVAALGLASTGCTEVQAPNEERQEVAEASEPSEPRPSLREQPAFIENFAIEAYSREQYPTTYAKFGSAVSAINEDRLKAAQIAASFEDCDSVVNSQITTGSPKMNRRYWVECGNLTRLYFDEEALAQGEPVELQTKADWIANGLKDW